MESDFLSCDWGTTSFRLRWVNGRDCSIVRETRMQAGVKSLYEDALRSGAGSIADRAAVFGRFLRARLEELAAGTPIPEQPMPLVISGMASSSVGWRELPYAPVPFALDGRSLRSAEIVWDQPEWIAKTFLISGIASQHDMMRGEETEIVGLMSSPGLTRLRAGALLILPGTHSKHVWIKNQSIVEFRTFMTGELFELLGRQSLLRASVEPDVCARSDFLEDSEHAAYQEGVAWGIGRGLAGGLFGVRTRAVLGGCPPANNTWFFSGLLIGAELREISATQEQPVVLAAMGRLSQLYSLALHGAGVSHIQVPAMEVERSTIVAHAVFLLNNFHPDR